MTTIAKKRLYGASPDEIKTLCQELQLPGFAHKQIVKWLYTRFVTDIESMTDLSKVARQRLAEHCELGLSAPLKVSVSSDGTKKYLFRTFEGEYIESALIPDGERMVDFLYKDTRTSKAYIVKTERKGVKKASLTFKTVATANTEKGTLSLVSVSLDTGRFHQIRAQFSSRGHAIVGDKKYGSPHLLRGGIALVSCHLYVELGDEKIDVSVTPDTAAYPWSLFADTDFTGA